MRDPDGPIIRPNLRLTALCWLLACGAAQAGAPTGVSVGVHDGGTQVVFNFGRHVGFGLQRDGDTVKLHFTGGGTVPDAEGDSHGVSAVHGGANSATIDLLPGSRIHSMRKGNRIVIVVLDPVGGRPSPSAVAPAPTPTPAAPVPAAAQGPATAGSSPASPQASAGMSVAAAAPAGPAATGAPGTVAGGGAQAASASAQPVPGADQASGPVTATPLPPPTGASAAAATDPAATSTPAEAAIQPASVAQTAELPAGTAGSAALLPFGARVGAAAFRRGGTAWVVFDERRDIDLAALQDDKLLSRATVQLLPAATVLRMPLDQGSELRLTHVPDGWTVAALPSAPPMKAINVVAKPTRFELPAPDQSQVVVVPDAETGQNLLVGTLRENPAGVPVARSVPAFVLQPTWQGVLVEPIADATNCHTTNDGFVIEVGGAPLSAPPAAAAALADAAYLTRRFDLPSGPPDTLMRRLHAQIAEAGEAPAQSRAKPRKAAAATLVSLALGVEAEAMLHLATTDDPRLVGDPIAIGLNAMAAMLGGRSGDTGGITDPALDGSDEVALWRAVRAAQAHEGAPEAAPVFASTIKLLLAYPAPLRAALLPLAVETMALGGAPDAADAVLTAMPNDPSLDFARALRMEAAGKTDQALERYDVLALGRDRLTAARAATRASLLRLKTHAITPGQAADQLEHQFLNWRGDGRELDLRLRVAELRAQTGDWRQAFTVLREAETLYPDSLPMIQTREAELMTSLLAGGGASNVSPLDLVALTEENAELVARVAPAKAAGLLADKLLALDLPRRAGPVLERMMRAAPVGVGQATLGARLAALRLGEGDDAGAHAALVNSNAPGLPAGLIERRGLVSARLDARAGHTNRAVATLVDLATPAADDLRASLLTDAQDWPGAAAATADLVAKTVPPDGPLTPQQQDTLLRLASALSRAKDDAGLRALAARQGARLDGPRAGMFQLLTAAPVSSVSDLGRSASELSLVKALPGGLAAMNAR